MNTTGKFAREKSEERRNQAVIFSDGSECDLEIDPTKEIILVLNAAHEKAVALAVQEAVERCAKIADKYGKSRAGIEIRAINQGASHG